jgi:hypothetical protein
MRKQWCFGALALGGALLAACAEQPASSVNPETGLVSMQTGVALLRCRDACLADWRREQPQAQKLDAGGQWHDLAVLVIRVGYQDDLSLYYLGRAAEGLGFSTGAASYYRQSTELSGTAIACATLSRQCGGVSLPQAASSRLAAVTIEINRARRPPPSAPPGKPTTPSESGTAGTTPAVAEPVPAVAPSPPPPAKPTDTKDYIEPPPAQR